jgi:hypothetical protein
MGLVPFCIIIRTHTLMTGNIDSFYTHSRHSSIADLNHGVFGRCRRNVVQTRPVSVFTSVILVLVFHSPLAGEAEAGSGAATKPKMQNVSMVRLALQGFPPSPHLLAPLVG